MIKFFRRIRQRLLTENKFSKYLIYAIGEIFLVVLGILIALQINNANEARKINQELVSINENIRQEFISNLDALNVVFQELEVTKKGGLKILSLIGTSESGLNEFNVDSLIEMSIMFPLWRPSSFTVNELKNSGKLSFLKNRRLKKLLFEWEKLTEYINNQNIRLEKSSVEIIDYVSQNGSLRNINHYRISIDKSRLGFNNIILFDDLTFENLVDSKLVYLSFLADFYNQANELIELILDETDKK